MPKTSIPQDADLTKKQVPTSRRFLWGIGGATDFISYYGLNGLMDAIYINAMALDPKIIGLARSLPRLLDLVTDPVLGHLSDNTKTRWGRRRPWMAAGAIVAALVAVLMWYPPLKAGLWPSAIFVVGMMVALYTFGYSMFTISYTALGYELSKNYEERTHIFQWRQYAAAVTGFLTPWFIPLCLALDGPLFNVTKGINGVHYVSIGIAAIILLTACGPIFGARETGEEAGKTKIKFREAIRITLRNKAFWPLLAGNFLAKFGTAITTCFFYYVMVYYVSGGDNKIGTAKLAIFYNSINIATVVAMTLVVRFTDRVGKRPAVLVLMLLSSLAYASVWFTLRPHHTGWVLSVADFLKTNCHLPALVAEIWPGIITGICIGIFTNSMPLIMNSMMADVCDVDELECGHQRQAFYGAIFVTCDKLAMAIAMLLQGFLVSVSGYNAKLVMQAPETVAFWMKALLVTQPTGFVLGFCCLLAYPITRAKAMEVRRLIDARRVGSGSSI
ncbi:MAG TPA: MFS transporter [Pseudomonadales bacterium]|nr:MFS transporter [Pseudomonadales bacterium]